MTLKTSLVLAGDASGAATALDIADKALARVDRSAKSLARAQASARKETEAAKAEYKSGALSLEQYNRTIIDTKTALSIFEERHRKASAEIRNLGSVATTSTGQARAGYVNLGRQMQDVSIQLQSGTNIGTIIAQQGGQVADALSQMGGRLAGFGAFMSGPWGAMITVGIGVLFNLAEAMWQSGEASDKSGGAIGSLKNKIDLSKNSYQSLIEVVREYNSAQTKSTALTYEAVIAAEAKARANLSLAKTELERAYQTNGYGPFGGDAAKGSAIGSARNRLDKMEADLKEANIAASSERTKRATDKRYDIEVAYNAELVKWQAKLRQGKVDSIALDRVMLALEKGKLAALDAYDKSKQTSHTKVSREPASARQFGREIDAREAWAIAQRAGMTPTSGQRSIEKQRWLYDNVRTAENPVAFPNANAPHIRGNALDIAFGKGISPESIRKTFADEGVKLTKLLKETGHFHIEWSSKGADKIVREAQKAEDVGSRTAEAIARINAQYDDQPRLVDQAAAATRELDRIITELSTKKPIDWQKQVADAEAGKVKIADALVRPFEQLRQESERRLQIQSLLTAGLDDEAAALQTIWQYEQNHTKATLEQKQAILDQVRAERQVTEELERRQAITQTYLEASRSIRQELTAVLSGQGSLKNIGKIFSNLKGQALSEQLFGGAFRDLESWIKGQSGLGSSVDTLTSETGRAASAAGGVADAFNSAMMALQTGAVAGPVSSGGISSADGTARSDAQQRALIDGFDRSIGAKIATLTMPSGKTVSTMTPARFSKELADRVTKPMVEQLDQIFGTEFFGKLQGVFSGAINGLMTGGVPGGILGALSGIKGLPDNIKGALDKGLKGTQTGTAVAGIGNALGIKMNSTGAQIGGAIGSFLPIPGGEIIGAIAGGLLGNLFEKKPRGAAEVSNKASNAHTNDAALTSSLGDWGTQVQSSIKTIADKLGATVGDYSIGLGRYKDYYQVSSKAGDPRLGNSYFGRDSKSAVYDGLDAEAAMTAAIKAALSQGAVSGLSAAVKKALGSSSDIEVALAEALKVKDVENLLSGLGDELRKQFTDFEKQATERLRIARQYGFDVVKLEERNAADRLALTKSLLADQVGSLQQLIDDMTSGSLFEGSAIDQRQLLLGQIADAKAKADAGTAGAGDTLAQLLTQLNTVSKDAYATTGNFAADRSTILDAARDTIAKANQRLTDAQATSDPALVTTNQALDENNSQNAQIIAELGITNERLAALAASGSVDFGMLSSLARTSKLGML